MGVLSLLSLVTAQPSFARGGGGGQPDPFTFNTHFELANDEYYLLEGTIVIGPALAEFESVADLGASDGFSANARPAFTGAVTSSRKQQAYLRVNLEDQSWLANPHRVAVRGLYPIEGSATPWRDGEGKPVKLAVRAHVTVSKGARAPLVSLHVIPELSQYSRGR